MNDGSTLESMCDCIEAEVSVEPSVQTSRIFEKCTNLVIQHTNCAAEILDTSKLTNIEKEGVSNYICERNPSSAEISTDSATTYKFVNQWKLQCKCDDDDDDDDEEEGGELEERSRSCHEEDDLDEFEEKAADVENTLAIIKPEAVVNRSRIEERIHEAGFEIQQSRWLQMTSEQISQFYADRYENPEFAHIVTYMAAGPIVVHVLAKKEAVQKWRLLMGPTKVSDARLYFPDSIRARYGTKGQDYKNAVHGSDTCQQAQREIHFFFPNFIVEPFSNWKGAENYLSEAVNKVLANGLALCCKEKPEDPILWLAHWLLANNPNTSKL